LFLPNTPHYVISFFGVLKAGGTVVNYSPLDAAKVLEHKIEDSRTDILITLDMASLYPQMAAMLGKTRLKKLVVGSLAEITADPDAVISEMKAARQLCEVAWDDRHVSFGQLIHNDGAFEAYPVADPAETIAVLQYTGGTTGLPKGAMLTHANLTSACQQYKATTAGSPPVLVEGSERMLAVLPPFHIYALSVNVLFGVLLAAEIIQQVRFDPKAALEEISSKQISVFCGVPTMFTALINAFPKENLRCGSQNRSSLVRWPPSSLWQPPRWRRIPITRRRKTNRLRPPAKPTSRPPMDHGRHCLAARWAQRHRRRTPRADNERGKSDRGACPPATAEEAQVLGFSRHELLSYERLLENRRTRFPAGRAPATARPNSWSVAVVVGLKPS
jgi:hypothetical protein